MYKIETIVSAWGALCNACVLQAGVAPSFLCPQSRHMYPRRGPSGDWRQKMF